ncbi:monodechloroaminopyrrolnitrin synthase PrnB family protein [Actinophytocola sp.]|uniref:monodechloroaminopyrrolnitrin synthase PrnB family protein n=1 Tax=Actinophytocola sp. TaxID=1872138 RepID=UPI003D6AE1E0
MAGADPLGADEFARRLPALNAAADRAGLVTAFRDLLPTPDALAGLAPHECLAAMRDLGMLLGSLKRHGVEPADAVPEAVPVLCELGARTDMVPRDTVQHYGPWNPADHRCRAYVGSSQEDAMQASMRLVHPHMRRALDLCDVLAGTEPRDPAFPAALGELTERTEVMTEAMDLVSGAVTPSYFAHIMRPYYEEVTIAGDVLLGPAAAQVPLWLVDLAVWASDRSEPDYQQFLAESVRYSLPKWRAYHTAWLSRESVVTRVVSALREAEDSPALTESATLLADLLRTITVFRGRHLSMARRSYRIEVRLYDLGSGGGNVPLLGQILDLTRQAASLVRARGAANAAR